MGFLAPALLALGALAGVPLLVHLLRRRVGRTVDFPAVRYLARMEQEHSRDLKLKHRLLLILRVLAVLLLALAAARPIARIAGVGHAPVAVALVLDNSMSTGAVTNGRTALDGMKTDALSLVRSLSADDKVWLVTADGRVVGGSNASVAAAIERVTPMGGRGDLLAALRRAGTLVRNGDRRSPAVALVTDGQRSALAPTDDTLRVALGDAALVTLVRPIPPIGNHAVTVATPEPARWTPAGGLAFAIASPDSQPWRVNLEGRTVARGVAAPAPIDDPARVAQRLSSSSTGWVRGNVELNADELRGDDTRWFAARVAPPASVAIRAEAGDFAATALATLVEERRLVRGAEGAAGVVTIAGADAPGVRGTLLLTAPLDPLRIGDANRTLARLGIPWRFGAISRERTAARSAVRSRRQGSGAGTSAASQGGRDAASGTGGQSADATPASPGTSGGATGDLRGAIQIRAANALDDVPIHLRYPLVASPGAALDSAARRVDTLAMAGGSAWAVAGPNYVLVGSPFDPDATELPLRAGFVPWLLDALSRRLGDEGELIEAHPGERIDDLNASALERPDGSVTPIGSDALVVPNDAGVYFLRRGQVRAGALVVNPEPAESDLRATDTVVTNRDAGALIRAQSIAQTRDAAAWREALFDRASGRSLLIPLAVLALLALALESFFARERAVVAVGTAGARRRNARAA